MGNVCIVWFGKRKAHEKLTNKGATSTLLSTANNSLSEIHVADVDSSLNDD